MQPHGTDISPTVNLHDASIEAVIIAKRGFLFDVHAVAVYLPMQNRSKIASRFCRAVSPVISPI
jgi:hypothetical protein